MNSERQDAVAEQCLNCGTETTQRAAGKPYCSMDCIGAKRRENEKEILRCPFPGCEWERRWIPDNGVSRGAAYADADRHRRDHATE